LHSHLAGASTAGFDGGGAPPRTPGASPDLLARLEVEAFGELRDLVLRAGSIDLNLYKDKCILRRITLRQRASGAPSLRAYLKVLNRNPMERERLVKALTIHVSQFFRNPSTFRAIQDDILPAILAEKRAGGGRSLRMWSVGCACGEEPYSLAILLLEAAADAVRQYSSAIYGTDIEPGCLRQAKEARYPARSLAQVPPHWRQRYFQQEADGYRLTPEARRLVFFKIHNILAPPPFSRIDLVVFRNVLIYMTDPLQERVLLALHETLNPGGYLVLGKVEGLAGSTRDLFEPVNLTERIYRKPAA
jgi:chemotaxis protein methyltransferase CheR